MKHLSKRLKLIIGIPLLGIILISGTLFGLVKTGKINLSMLANDLSTLPIGGGTTTGTTTGITGTYYQLDPSDTYTTTAGVARVDPPYIYYPGNSLTPPTGINRENFFVNWAGQAYVPADDAYTFRTTSDDGVRLWVNGAKIIDNWGIHGVTTNTATVNLSAGYASIVLDYFNGPIDSDITLAWSSPNMAIQTVPFSIQTCPTGQHLDRNTGKCVNTAPTQTPFGLRGTIKDGTSASSSYIGDANVAVLNKADPANPTTLATGKSTSSFFTGGTFYSNYQTSTFVLPNNSYSNIYLDISAAGKQSMELQLSGSILGNSSDGGTVYDQVKPIVMAISTGKIDIQGLVKDDAGSLLPNLSVTVNCDPFMDATQVTACKNKITGSPWGQTKSTTQTTHNNVQNYSIGSVYDFSNDTSFDHISISVQSPGIGYYYDANKNGKQDSNEWTGGGTPYLTVLKSDIKPPIATGENSFVLKDVVFTKIPQPATIAFGLRGSLKDSAGNYVDNDTVTVLDKTNPSDAKILATATSATFDIGGGIRKFNYQTLTSFVLPKTNPFKSIYLSVTAPGKQPIDLDLSQAGSLIGTEPGTFPTYKYVKDLVLVSSTGKLDIQGLVKDSYGHDLPNIKVTVSCDSGALGLAACNTRIKSAQATSRSNRQTTHGSDQNYNIIGLYDFNGSGSDFDRVNLSANIPSNYYYDKNSDGHQGADEPAGGSTPAITIFRSDIKYDNASGHNAFVLVKPIILNRVTVPPLNIASAELAAWPGHPNYFKYSDNHVEAWCADFVSWVYGTAGYNVPRIPGAAAIGDYFKDHPNEFVWIDNPKASQIKPDDVVLYGNVPKADSPSGFHVGIVGGITPSFLATIEGNVSDSVGGRSCPLTTNKSGQLLCHRQFATITVVGVGRPK
jgi:hypothetical protein